ncbi:MAG TPA: DUF1634 domain-containing protein [Rhodopila sp.]|nr:DUF1634 domain-containing protein [Rhodopila sp.]
MTLTVGTWLASAIIAAGLALTLAGQEGAALVTAGVAVFISLPVMRVLLMLGAFIRARDVPFVTAATLVLAIIAVSITIGCLSRSHPSW